MVDTRKEYYDTNGDKIENVTKQVFRNLVNNVAKHFGITNTNDYNAIIKPYEDKDKYKEKETDSDRNKYLKYKLKYINYKLRHSNQ